MKIETPTPPQAPRSSPIERKQPQEVAAPEAPQKAPKAPEGRDTVQISHQAATLRSTADAKRVAGETRDLIASGNKEAVLAQPVDTKRLQELMRATGATRETPAPGNG